MSWAWSSLTRCKGKRWQRWLRMKLETKMTWFGLVDDRRSWSHDSRQLDSLRHFIASSIYATKNTQAYTKYLKYLFMMQATTTVTNVTCTLDIFTQSYISLLQHLAMTHTWTALMNNFHMNGSQSHPSPLTAYFTFLFHLISTCKQDWNLLYLLLKTSNW